MTLHRVVLVIDGRGRGLNDVTSRVAEVVRDSGVQHGLVSLFLQHTSASLLVQENADPDVLRDLEDWFVRQAPDGDPRYRHVDEGPDDMSGHLRSSVTDVSLTIPVDEGRMMLGVWQAIYLFEHRIAPKARRIVVSVLGA